MEAYRREGLSTNLGQALQPYLKEYDAVLEAAQHEENWDGRADSIHYTHLAAAFDDRAFELTHELLERLSIVNSFQLSEADDTVLFGLRGCGLVDGGAAKDRKLTAREKLPNHYSMECILGVWQRREKRIFAYRGSTVPNVSHLFAHHKGIMHANLLPTGLHPYVTGYHNNVPGAFIQASLVPVLRTAQFAPEVKMSRIEPFSSKCEWDATAIVADNIHPGYFDTDPIPPTFASAGCQVVAGIYIAGQGHMRDWAQFRRNAGLPEAFKAVDQGKPFSYMLLTGREASLVSRTLGDRMSQSAVRLRFGSSGESVSKLQKRLAISNADGMFGSETMMRFIRWQHAQKFTEDGIATIANTRAMGLTW